jgi:hypothetical protein
VTASYRVLPQGYDDLTLERPLVSAEDEDDGYARSHGVNPPAGYRPPQTTSSTVAQGPEEEAHGGSFTAYMPSQVRTRWLGWNVEGQLLAPFWWLERGVATTHCTTSL